MSAVLEDFKPGPLDQYRKSASFDWKKLKVFLYTEQIVQYEHELCEMMRKDPVFNDSQIRETSLNEKRRLAARQMFAIKKIEPIRLSWFKNTSHKDAATYFLLFQLTPSGVIKYNLSFPVLAHAIQFVGTKRHSKFVEQVLNGEVVGCFCMTEIGHGSNTKAMQTTATYNKQTKEFVLHTPTFEACKAWSGGLGKCATHALVFAQLVIDEKMLGLHAFLVQIRDTKTLNPLPGIIIGDMGEKAGLNGIDNGFMQFIHHKIPRENLLNKYGDVSEDGVYSTKYEDQNKKHAAMIGGLSIGRAYIICNCCAYLIRAISIAIRYAAIRKQFGPEQKEMPILEYQTHQYRLLPYLSLAFILKNVCIQLLDVQYEFNIDLFHETNSSDLPYLQMELHILCSGLKSVAGWLVRDGIQQCKDACGGHGYLKASELGTIKNDHDANCIYEGDNYVLISQTSNWLIRLWPLILNGQKLTSPLSSVNFLSNALDILKIRTCVAKTQEQILSTNYILSTYQWLVCYLLKLCHEKTEKMLKNGETFFSARNHSQIFYAHNLAETFIQHYILQQMLTTINKAPDLTIKNILLKLFSLYGLWTLEKYSNTLYQGGYFEEPEENMLVKETILLLCKELKSDSVALVDVIAPPDFILNSVLGMSDGQVYQRLQQALLSTPDTFTRTSWWQDITSKLSKL